MSNEGDGYKKENVYIDPNSYEVKRKEVNKQKTITFSKIANLVDRIITLAKIIDDILNN